MKHMKKILTVACAMALSAAIAIGGTLAYLTSTDEVVNTFTVGNVQIKLDEAKANADGSLVDGADRVQANSYKLLPGHTYNKDPMVTVLANSEACYVFASITFNKVDEINAIEALDIRTSGLSKLLGGMSNKWELMSNTVNDDSTQTILFKYNAVVPGATTDTKLDKLFTTVTLPGEVTNAELATLEGFEMTINAYAIQADGFASAEAAWAAYANQAKD